MNSSIYRFTLDLHSSQSQISVPVLLGDSARTFRINLSDGGNPYIIEDGCLAKLSIKRPTGTYLEEFCLIEKSTTIVYPFEQNENTASVEGIHECDITLYDADGIEITGPRFSMVVSERVVRTDDVNLSDEDQRVIDAMVRAEASRQVAETSRVNAEAERASAEKERAEAEAARATATQAAIERANTAAANVKDGKDGADGKDGKSAYESAQEAGYAGTEVEFGKALADIASVTIYEGEVEAIV